MCGRTYVPLSELALSPDEQSLIPIKSISTIGARGRYDLYFTNKRLIALSTFTFSWKNLVPSGASVYVAGVPIHEGKVDTSEEQKREKYEELTFDQALRMDTTHNFQIAYEDLVSVKVSGHLVHSLEILSKDRKEHFALDPVDYACLLGALPQIPQLVGKLDIPA